MTEKDKFQSLGRDMSLEHPFLAIEAATGTGKGKLCMMAIEADPTPGKWLVVIPENLQIISLQNDIRKHDMEHIYDKIENIICYASLPKYAGKEFKIWLNEVHRLSECKVDISSTIKSSRIIADSATISSDIRLRLDALGKFKYLKLSLNRAIETGIIPSPTIYLVGLDLDDEEKVNPAEFGKNTYMLTDKQFVENYAKSLKYWSDRLKDNPKETWIQNKFKVLGGARKKFLAEKKTEALKRLLAQLEGKRIVCYVGSKEQGEKFSKARSIHSGKSKKVNTKILSDFNEGIISDIYLNKMGREGMNFSDLDTVIVVQLSTGKDEGLEFLQKGGRMYRSKNPEMYILYFRNCIDEKWKDLALENVDKKYVKEFSL